MNKILILIIGFALIVTLTLITPSGNIAGKANQVINAEGGSPLIYKRGSSDINPPVVTHIDGEYTVTSKTTAAISFTTDEPSEIMFEYGRVGNGVIIDTIYAGYDINHIILLNGLLRNAHYFYRITATDQHGNSHTYDGIREGDSVGYDFVMDTVPPEVLFYDIPLEPTQKGSPVSVAVSFQENIYPKHVEMIVNNEQYVELVKLGPSDDNNPTFSRRATIQTNNLPVGTNTFVIKVYDHGCADEENPKYPCMPTYDETNDAEITGWFELTEPPENDFGGSPAIAKSKPSKIANS